MIVNYAYCYKFALNILILKKIMEKILLGSIVCLTMSTALFISCNKTGKDQVSITPQTQALKTMSARFGFTDLPKNEKRHFSISGSGSL